MRYSFAFLFCSFWCLPLLSQVPDSAKYLSLEPYDFHLQYLRHDSALLIDVREFFEYRRSRIHGSLLISPSTGFEEATDTINKNIAIFCYCYNGGRSVRALLYFYDEGFRRLYNLEGGIVAWRRDGFPVERSRVRKKR